MIWQPLVDWQQIPRSSGIYVLRNTLNGKEYVGQAASLRKRVREHRRALSDQCVHRAIQKYGAEYFQVLILPAALNELDGLEASIISERGSLSPAGYNISAGGIRGMVGFRHTEESRQKMSRAKLLHNGMRGKKLSQEARETLGKALRGKQRSPEICEKFRQVQLGRLSSERARELAGRPVLAWLPGSLTPATFDSVKSAAEWAGITKATLFKWLGGAARSQMRTKQSDNARAAASAAWAYVREM